MNLYSPSSWRDGYYNFHDDRKTAMMLEVPFRVDARVCDAGFDDNVVGTGKGGVVLMELYGDPDQRALGRFKFMVALDLWSGEVWIDTAASPVIEKMGRRTVSYRTMFMEKLPWRDLCGFDGSHDLLARLYFSAHNTYLNIKRVGRPFEQVYHSLLSMGPGAELFKELTPQPYVKSVEGPYVSVPVPEGGVASMPPDMPRLYSLYWSRDETDLESKTRTYSNFLDDLNLHYGARSYPVKAPMLEAASSAPAVYMVIQ